MQAMTDTVTQVCVIYRPDDGRMVHVHFEAFVAGMKLYGEDRMEQLARQRAAAKGRDLTNVRFLHLRDPKLAGVPKRVNPQTGELELADPRSFANRPPGQS